MGRPVCPVAFHAKGIGRHAAPARLPVTGLGARRASLVSTGAEISRRDTGQRGRCRVRCRPFSSVPGLVRIRGAKEPPPPARNVGRASFRRFLSPCEKRPSIRALAVGLASHHPGRSTLPREPFSLRRASGVSLEYLLLSPRSAPARVPARECPEPSPQNRKKSIRAATAYSLFLQKEPPGTGSPLSVLHFRGYSIRRASYYALLRRFQLPWPRPRCLHRITLFTGSGSRALGRLGRGYWFIPHRQSCLPRVAH